MSYLDALLEAKSALECRRRWYAARNHRPQSRRRARELDEAIARVQELANAARAMTTANL